MTYSNRETGNLSYSDFFSPDDERKQPNAKYEFTENLYLELKEKILG